MPAKDTMPAKGHNKKAPKHGGIYPRMQCKNDRAGLFRRQLFQVVLQDVRVLTPPAQQLSTASVQPLTAGGDDWAAFLETVCRSAAADKYSATPEPKS